VIEDADVPRLIAETYRAAFPPGRRSNALRALLRRLESPPGSGGPDEGERRALERLRPHVERATSLARRAGLPSGAGAAAEVVERLTPAVLLVDEGRGVLRANRAAQDLLASERALTLRTGRLAARHPATTARLSELCAAAAGAGRAPPADIGLAVPRGHGRRPLSLRVAPLSRGARLEEPGAVAAVFVSPPAMRNDALALAVARVLGLTLAEARLAWILVGGASVEDAAGRLSIRPVTVRNHIRSALRKTGCRRQAELVRLLLLAMPPIRVE